jgi:hypothetical protein
VTESATEFLLVGNEKFYFFGKYVMQEKKEEEDPLELCFENIWGHTCAQLQVYCSQHDLPVQRTKGELIAQILGKPVPPPLTKKEQREQADQQERKNWKEPTTVSPLTLPAFSYSSIGLKEEQIKQLQATVSLFCLPPYQILIFV